VLLKSRSPGQVLGVAERRFSANFDQAPNRLLLQAGHLAKAKAHCRRMRKAFERAVPVRTVALLVGSGW